MRESKPGKMDKDKIRAEFNDFIDNASESTLNDFIKYMKARKKAKAEIDAKIEQVLKEDDEDIDDRKD